MCRLSPVGRRPKLRCRFSSAPGSVSASRNDQGGTVAVRKLWIAGALVAAAVVLGPAAARSSTDAAGIAPTAAQKQAVSALGAHAAWNSYGTPSSLIKVDGYLATGLSG